MYIEVIHNQDGNILGCWCDHFYPKDHDQPWVRVQGGLPEGQVQARINIDTMLAMEISQESGEKAIIENGQPKIVNIVPSEYIMSTFKVDMSQVITPPASVQVPQGMLVRGLIRK